MTAAAIFGPWPPGPQDQALILAAIEEAAASRRERIGYAGGCEACAPGKCGEHEADAAAAAAYDDLADRLQGHEARMAAA